MTEQEQLFPAPAPQQADPPAQQREPRVRITAMMEFELSVPASWTEDEEFLEDPEDAVHTWIVENAGCCIEEADLVDHTVWPGVPSRPASGLLHDAPSVRVG